MAQYVRIGAPINQSEAKGMYLLREHLPEQDIIIGNFELHLPRRKNTLEFDVVVISDWGVWAVEIKGWSGRIRGDMRRWQLDWGRVESPLFRIESKTKALRDTLVRRVPDWPEQLYCEAVVFLPSRKVDVRLEDDRGERILRPEQIHEFFYERGERMAQELGLERLTADFKARVVEALVPLARETSEPKVINHYEFQDELETTDLPYREFIGRHQLIRSRSRVRIKAYSVDPLIPASERESAYNRAIRDMEALSALEDNPYVARAYDLIQDVEDELVFYLVSEWVSPSTMADIVEQHPEGVPAPDCWRYARDLCKAVSYMHSQRVVHRNLHPGVVYVISAEQDPSLKIADFDFARMSQLESIAGSVPKIGTDGYTAPELWQRRRKHDHRVDIFAVGAILFELLSGQPLYDDPGQIVRHQEIWEAKRDALPNKSTADLLARLLAADPDERIDGLEEAVSFFETCLAWSNR